MAGMKTIIGLAFMLAVGILLVILSCALYGYASTLNVLNNSRNWWPLLVVLTYTLAPVPNLIMQRCAGGDDLFGSDDNRFVFHKEMS
jgi:uncharacterized membrane protein YbhN (UPF0104 family)